MFHKFCETILCDTMLKNNDNLLKMGKGKLFLALNGVARSFFVLLLKCGCGDLFDF